MSVPMSEEGNAMARETRTDVQKTDNGSVPAVPEQTRPGPIYSPAVDIFENESSITVFADMPGVKAQDLKVDLRGSVLTLTGQVGPPETAREGDVLRD
jgi:HSP20 family protein